MHLVFFDDSSQKGIREGMGQLLSVGGIFIGEEKLYPLQDEVIRIANKYSIPSDCELKWSPPRSNWIYNNLKGIDRQNCYQEILEATFKHDVKVVVITFDTGRTTLQGAKVTAKVLSHVKGDKVIVFKKKRRKGYQKKNGHRQYFTQIQIEEIVG